MRAIFLAFLLVAPIAEIGMGIPATSGLKGAEWAVAVVDGDTLVLDGGWATGSTRRHPGTQIAPWAPELQGLVACGVVKKGAGTALSRETTEITLGSAYIDLHGCASWPICRMTLMCGSRVRS